MKIAFRSTVAKSRVARLRLSKSFAVVSATLAVTSWAHAQTSVAPPSGATSSAVPAPKTSPAKIYNCALDADLRVAVYDISKLRSLLLRGADPNAKDTDPDATPLLSNAAMSGRLDVVRVLLEAGADVNVPDSKGMMTPLSCAVLVENNLEVVKYLLQRGANTESRTPSGMTPLMSAASNGKTELTRVLIEAGANVNARSSINATPLFYACDNKDAPDERMEIVKMLVNAGADVSVVASHNGRKAREAASDKKLVDIEKYLVDIYNRDITLLNVIAKASRELKTATPSTRLANWQAVKDALAKGANPRYSDSTDGLTPLILFIGPFNALIVTLDDNDATMKTIIARSDLDAQEKTLGFTALHVAVDNNNAQMVKWLIEADANLNVLDNKNRTPLDLALVNKRQNAIPLLQNAGAKTYAQLQNPNAATPTPSTPAAPVEAAPPANTIAKSPLDKIIMEGYDQGVTVLMRAAKAGNVAEIERLLKAGATVDIVGPEDGHTALFFAVFGNSADAIKALLKAGANVNFLNHTGKPPLVSASFRGSAATVRALVEAGADLKYLDDAIANATDGENTAVIDYLTALKTAPKTPSVKTPIASDPKSNSAPTQSTPVATKTIPANYKSTLQDQTLHFALFVVAHKKAMEQKVPDSNWSPVRTALAENATAFYADEDGVTALMLVAKALPGATDEIERKIFESANINAQDKNGATALHIAAENNYTKMIGWLIKSGAKLNVVNAKNQTPLDLALALKKQNTITLLQNAGAKTYAQLK